MNAQTKIAYKTPMGEGYNLDGITVVTQQGHTNWSLEDWMYYDCHCMVEFTGNYYNFDTDEEEPFPIYFAMVVTYGMGVETVTKVIKQRMDAQPDDVVCFVCWMDPHQRDHEFIVRHFVRVPEEERALDTRTLEPLSQDVLDGMMEGDEAEYVLFPDHDAMIWQAQNDYFGEYYYEQMYNLIRDNFPLLNKRYERVEV